MTNIVKFTAKFSRDQKGIVAPMLGLMVIPMLAITGAAIDIGQAITAEKVLQNAVDSAALAVCSASPDESPDDVVKAFLAAGLEGSKLELGDGTSTPSSGKISVQLEQVGFSAEENSVNPIAKATVPTSLLKLSGIPEIDIMARTKVGCGAKDLELSMVMDVTGSMNSYAGGKRKIESLREASNEVISIFERNITAGATRVALVPFSEAVNVGQYASKVRGEIASGTSQNPGSAGYTFKNKKNDYKTYQITECVSERVGGHAAKSTVPSCSGSHCTQPVGLVYTSGGVCKPENKFMPLSGNAAALREAINSYQPNGYTAGHIGAAWGWYALLDSWGGFWPDAAAAATDRDKLIKATIIMTDGEFNTQYLNGVQDRDRSGSSPNGSSNQQFEEICSAMKVDNIEVYTVGFGLSEGSDTAQRLQSCASDSGKFFLTDNGDGLRSVFNAISRQLSAGQAVVSE
ncbi:MAG: hypothetical protein KJ622_02430 [Alphaproteobacteria bacterium]|nr:hypothetical protein [Alphaproteobacteria bacterium]